MSATTGAAGGGDTHAHDDVVKRVRAALESERRVNLHRHPVKISITDDALELDGEVDGVAAKKIAVGIANSISRQRVVDRLRVAVPERRGDGAIRTSLAALLMAETELRGCTIRARTKGRLVTLHQTTGEPSGEIEIGVDDGVITLEGRVISLSHKRLAGVIGWWTPGCRDVVNALEVVPAEEDNDAEVVEALGIVLEADPMIDSGRVAANCRDRVVTLDGFVPTDEERRRAEDDAWALFDVADVVNRIGVGAAG